MQKYAVITLFRCHCVKFEEHQNFPLSITIRVAVNNHN